ncbi:unnamed protein product [Amoebophrya sp. A120]|nr:unnamed protein product [Amoebophrya sp. A120]|eukprot:GSA120T00013250001.1
MAKATAMMHLLAAQMAAAIESSKTTHFWVGNENTGAALLQVDTSKDKKVGWAIGYKRRFDETHVAKKARAIEEKPCKKACGYNVNGTPSAWTTCYNRGMVCPEFCNLSQSALADCRPEAPSARRVIDFQV